jgi:hypothetical protein
MTSAIGSRGKEQRMSDVTEKKLDQKVVDREDLVAVELTEKEMEEVNGGWFFPFNNSQSLALTTIAFTNNNSGVW